MSVPNQKTILIERTSDKVTRDYFKVSNENLAEALSNLNPSAFKLWVYFADNMNGYKEELYPINVCQLTGIGRSTYTRAFKELEGKGYLIQSKVQKNTYLFKEKSDITTQPDLVKTVDTEDFNAIVSELF